jgi:uncharacterized protein (UPF0548 family)
VPLDSWLLMIDRLLPGDKARHLQGQALTYREEGATAKALPAAYHHVDFIVTVGSGSAQFAAASEALINWGVHERAGLQPRASSPLLAAGSVAILRWGIGMLAVSLPVRVVYLVDESRRCGFAYGSLPGHPERGEELFLLELSDDDAVTFRLKAFSRPGRWFTRLGGPLGRAAQRAATARYVNAVRAAARAAAS